MPQRIVLKQPPFSPPRAANQMIEEQQKQFDKIGACCPDALLLRSYALEFRDALQAVKLRE